MKPLRLTVDTNVLPTPARKRCVCCAECPTYNRQPARNRANSFVKTLILRFPCGKLPKQAEILGLASKPPPVKSSERQGQWPKQTPSERKCASLALHGPVSICGPDLREHLILLRAVSAATGGRRNP